jgi:hypothetical protein
VGFTNSAGDQRDFAVDLGEIGFPSGANLHDVWSGKDLGHHSGKFNQTVPKHGVTLYIFSV